MKPREARRKVLIRARMRIASRWSDVCILNMSSRGLLLQSAVPPQRGVYVELRRGRHVIVARAVWSSQHRFGVRSQDRLEVDSIISEPDGSAAAPDDGRRPPPIERRAAPRQRRHDHSRLVGRALEFGCVGIFAASAAVGIYSTVAPALARPPQFGIRRARRWLTTHSVAGNH